MSLSRPVAALAFVFTCLLSFLSSVDGLSFLGRGSQALIFVSPSAETETIRFLQSPHSLTYLACQPTGALAFFLSTGPLVKQTYRVLPRMATTTASTAETDMETAGVALSSETVKTSAPLLQKKPMQIEVEKRFFIPDTLSERIQRLGGRQEKFVTFSDSYWDFPDPPFSPPNSTKTTETQNGHTFLTNQDIWLRRRTVTSSGAVPSSQWELKVPLDLSGASSEGGEGEGKRGGSARSGGELATFHEIEGVRDVSLELLRLLEDADIPSEDRKVTDHLGPLSCLPDCEGSLSESPADETESLEAALRKMGMAPFAEFETRRTKFSVPVRVGGLQGTRGVEEVKGDSDRISQNRDETEKLMRASVDVDAASFGHGVMEIELLCERPEDVSKMENAIVTLAAEMGASQMGNHGGKLETYIRRFCPSVLQRLQRCGILR